MKDDTTPETNKHSTETARGATSELRSTGLLECRECNGTGAVDSGGVTPWGSWIMIECPYCGGKGSVTEEDAAAMKAAGERTQNGTLTPEIRPLRLKRSAATTTKESNYAKIKNETAQRS